MGNSFNLSCVEATAHGGLHYVSQLCFPKTPNQPSKQPFLLSISSLLPLDTYTYTHTLRSVHIRVPIYYTEREKEKAEEGKKRRENGKRSGVKTLTSLDHSSIPSTQK